MFKQELLKDRHIGVFIENEEQVNLLAKWIEENADRQYNRYDSDSSKHIVNNVLFTSYEHGNCYEFDDKKDAEKKLNKIISFKKAIALEPVSNFNNTWCLNTIEHKNTLLHFQHINLINEMNNTFEIYYTSSTDIKRQIQLIDGDFYYTKKEENGHIQDRHADDKLNTSIFSGSSICVESKDNQLEKWGFEKPDFECEIYKKYETQDCQTFYNGAVWIRPKNDYHYMHTISWDAQGRVVHNHVEEKWLEKYNLTPIKKQWYEDESSFGKVLIDTGNNSGLYIFKGVSYHSDIERKVIDAFSVSKLKECRLVNFENFRPATESEILSLKVDFKK